MQSLLRFKLAERKRTGKFIYISRSNWQCSKTALVVKIEQAISCDLYPCRAAVKSSLASALVHKITDLIKCYPSLKSLYNSKEYSKFYDILLKMFAHFPDAGGFNYGAQRKLLPNLRASALN